MTTNKAYRTIGKMISGVLHHTLYFPKYVIDADLIKNFKVYDHVIVQDLRMFSEFHQQAIFISDVQINVVLRWWKKK